MPENDPYIFKLTPRDGKNASMGDLAKALEFMQRLFRDGDRLLGGNRDVRYEVLFIQHEANYDAAVSPVMEDCDHETSSAGLRHTIDSINEISKTGRLPDAYDARALTNLSKYGEISNKFENIKAPFNGEHLIIDTDFETRVRALLSAMGRQTCWGSLRGVIKRWKGDDPKKLTFHIKPDEGGDIVRCTYPIRLDQLVIDATNKYIEVSGELVFEVDDEYPSEIRVTDIDILDQSQRTDLLWNLEDSSPNATGDLSSEDFIRELRDEQGQ